MNFTKSNIKSLSPIFIETPSPSHTPLLWSTLYTLGIELKKERRKPKPFFFLILYSILTTTTTTHEQTQTRTHTRTHTCSTQTSTFSSYQSRFLNKSKSSAVVSPTTASKITPTASAAHHSIDDDVNNTGDDSDSIYGTGRTRYLALKERRNRLARSRSSHTMANDDDNDSTHLDEPVSPTTANPNAYLASRCDFVSFVNICMKSKEMMSSSASRVLKLKTNRH